MIYYPILKLKEMGIKSILLVSGKGHAGHFLELLGAGTEFGLSIAYEVQEEAGGIAQALSLAKDFVGDQRFAVMLGDNIYEDTLTEEVHAFEKCSNEAHIFLKSVANPQNYGVPQLVDGKIIEILEKPKEPPSPYAVTGFYLYTPDVFDVIKSIKPSARGELEISEVNDYYVKKGKLGHSILEGFWGDCGESIDHMMTVAQYIQGNNLSQKLGASFTPNATNMSSRNLDF